MLICLLLCGDIITDFACMQTHQILLIQYAQLFVHQSYLQRSVKRTYTLDFYHHPQTCFWNFSSHLFSESNIFLLLIPTLTSKIALLLLSARLEISGILNSTFSLTVHTSSLTEFCQFFLHDVLSSLFSLTVLLWPISVTQFSTLLFLENCNCPFGVSVLWSSLSIHTHKIATSTL